MSDTDAARTAMITSADESFTHQRVAPAAATTHVHPRWAERCWHLVDLGDGWVLGAGRALWPHAGRRTAVAGLNVGGTMWAHRESVPHSADDPPDRPDVGRITIETLEPLHRVRLRLDDVGFGFDLVWQARLPPVATDPNRIERGGEVLTDYMNYYHSGTFTGHVIADGVERHVQGRRGFRDRGWGLRRHEGAARRGMHVFVGCELPDRAIYALLYETADATRVFTNGWVVEADGTVDDVTAVEHDLDLVDGILRTARFGVTLASGTTAELTFATTTPLFMEALGYTAVPGRADPGTQRLDVADPGVAANWRGLLDHAGDFSLDGTVGHGYVEVGLGTHSRYWPDGGP